MLLRRWKRFMLLPETVLLAGVLLCGGYLADRYDIEPGQQAHASINGVIEDGVPTAAMRNKQKSIQKKIQQDESSLLSYTAAEIVNAFTYPDMKREDGGMTILQFRGNECILDVYVGNAGSPVSYEFRERQMAKTNAQLVVEDVHPGSCVDDILKSRHI